MVAKIETGKTLLCVITWVEPNYMQQEMTVSLKKKEKETKQWKNKEMASRNLILMYITLYVSEKYYNKPHLWLVTGDSELNDCVV